MGGLVVGAVSLVVGTLVALVLVGPTVAENCPAYDDEGMSAAPGSAYNAVLCEPAGYPEWGAVPIALLTLALALVLAAVLRRRSRPTVAVTTAVLALGPVVLLAVLHGVLPQDCLGGPDGTQRCERDRELR